VDKIQHKVPGETLMFNERSCFDSVFQGPKMEIEAPRPAGEERLLSFLIASDCPKARITVNYYRRVFPPSFLRVSLHPPVHSRFKIRSRR
jgi:hypothetical protein